MAYATSRFARHLPSVAAFATVSWSTTSSRCEAPKQEAKTAFGMMPDAEGDFHNLFPTRQLWQPRLQYPLWDQDWDGRSPPSSGKEEEDRRKMRKLRKEGVTRHIILIRHGQYDETYKEDEKRILTPLGRKQAELTGKRLKEMLDGATEEFGPCNIKVVRVSDMTRAKETANIIVEQLPGIEYANPDPDLNEGRPAHSIPGSKASSSTIQRTDENHPRIERAFRRYFYRADPPVANEDENKDKPKHEFEVIVCHANVLRYFLCRALQLPPEAWLRLCTFNCSMTYLTIRPTGSVSCRMLGDIGHIPYGMSWISTPELVAAVSNAGGIGILATGPLSTSETRASIEKIRSLTDKPFGIGATLLMPGAKENAKVALEEQVPVINVSLGKAEWIADGLSQYGGKMLATVTTQKHAQAALDTGADALMVTGHEAAAHGGAVTSLVLVPSMRQAFPDVPIVAAGGFANGRGLTAALALGADAVAMGSRMAVTQESPLALAAKESIMKSTEHETVYGSNFDGIPARVLKTPKAEQVMEKRPWLPIVIYRAFQAAQQMNIPMWKVLPGLLTQWEKMYTVAQFGAATESIMAATVDGKMEEGVQFIGQCQGMIDDIPVVDDLVQRIMAEAKDVHREQRLQLEDTDDSIDVKRAQTA